MNIQEDTPEDLPRSVGQNLTITDNVDTQPFDENKARAIDTSYQFHKALSDMLEVNSREAIYSICDGLIKEAISNGLKNDLEVINYVIQGILVFPEDLIDDTKNSNDALTRNKNLAQKYLDKSKLIVLSAVEYLLFVQKFEWYKVKSYLTNLSLDYFPKTFNLDDITRLETLRFVNSFLPNLISELSNKENVEQLSRDLLDIISKIRTNINGIYLTNPFPEDDSTAIEAFIANYAPKSRDEIWSIMINLENALKSEHAYGGSHYDSKIAIKTQNNTTAYIVAIDYVISLLTNPDFVSKEMDAFINDISRNLGLRYLPIELKVHFNHVERTYIEDNLKIDLANVTKQKRLSVKATRDNLNRAEAKLNIVNRLDAAQSSAFDYIFGSILDSIKSDEGDTLRWIFNDNTSQVISNAEEGSFEEMREKESQQIKDPKALVYVFFKVFEVAITNFSDRFLSEKDVYGDTLIFQLFIIKYGKFVTGFSKSDMPVPLGMVNFANLVTQYFRSRGVSGDVNTLSLSYCTDLESTMMKRKQLPKIDRLKTDEASDYEDYIIEVFSTFMRTEYHEDLYFANSMEQFFSDFNSHNPDTRKIYDLVDNIFGNIVNTFRARFKPLNEELLIKTLQRLLIKEKSIQQMAIFALNERNVRLDRDPRLRLDLSAQLRYFVSSSIGKPAVVEA